MSEINKSYRIKANVGGEYKENFVSIDTSLMQDYDTLDILSLKIKSSDTYRLHNSNYGVVVGRVLANNGFGIPNAKISIFIKADSTDGEMVKKLYPFTGTYVENDKGVRYNLLPDEKVDDCHQVVGTFPNKQFMLDNDVVLEVFDKYYKYTTRTNNSGDYLIMGVPVGNQTLHVDLDLSDCGVLSQRPRDFVFKGYTVEQFENSSLFKSSTNLSELSQIFTQDIVVNVIPFWGNESLGEIIGITRADIDIPFKFETTCVFIGCAVSDNPSNGITKRCIPTENMGNMEELTTGEGTIEMIRKTPTGAIESFAIKGNRLINGDGVWCYQIPMNLDYMMTDEYGNMVPTNDPEKGIPTRASVRFRISLEDNSENLDFYYRCKVLVPHNPQYNNANEKEEYDYEFGSYTKDESFRDLFWDNVYTVKSYIPRFQKKKSLGWKGEKFSGIKSCNFYGNNNPIPYNNIRIKLPLMFTVLCAILKCYIALVKIINMVIYRLGFSLAKLGYWKIFGEYPFKKLYEFCESISLIVLSEGLCPDLENWYFSPIAIKELKSHKGFDILEQTLTKIKDEHNGFYDAKSLDYENKLDNENEEESGDTLCITTKIDYLIACLEMNLAMEYRVINFDFYNDWINGMIYIPRFMRFIRPKMTFGNWVIRKTKVKGCMDDVKTFARSRRYTQQCSIGYNRTTVGECNLYSSTVNPLTDNPNKRKIRKANNFHKKSGFSQFTIFEKNGGICHEHTTSRKQNVYYMKPCEWHDNAKVLLYATDLVLLGSLKSCDTNGLPQAFKYLTSTSYIMPTNLALTNMETNGMLFVNDKKTLCAGKSEQNMTRNTGNDPGVAPMDPNDGIVAELMAYNVGDIDVQYEGNEFTDVIPLTEAAGISWNYTGPGQGPINENRMYYPGGHFLGLSCVNSQTNLKSCINLSRICEVGTTISQRKEDVIDVGQDGDFDYIYTAPTGFISGNEINGEDFRTMFATMNQKRLKAEKMNNETGYYEYDLEFVKPLNFNGAFKKVVNDGIDSYNAKVEVQIDDDETLKKFGINKGLGYDFDPNERLRTQTRTIEHPSVDYYRFRFGLSYEDIKSSNSVKHNSKFLYTLNDSRYLPQYENSYYFYFGLKAGASAIDEFNKQFFATCDTSIIDKTAPTIAVNVDDIKLSGQTGDVSVVLENVEMPLQNITYIRQVEGGNLEINDITSEWGQYYVISLNDIPFGTYMIEVVDFTGARVSTTFSIGIDIIKYQITPYNFNVDNADVFSKLTDAERQEKHLLTGGYIEISNVDIGDSYINDISSALTFFVMNVPLSSANTATLVESAFTTYNVINNSTNSDSKNICVKSAYTNYNLYLLYSCFNESGETEQLPLEKALFLETFQVKDGSKLSLAMGWKDMPFYSIVTSSGNSRTITPVESAWTVDDKKYTEYIEEIDNIVLNFGDNKGGKWWENPDLFEDSGTSVSNWLKRINTTKTTSFNQTFSNNVFAINGDKRIWGVPQNSKEVYNTDTVFSDTDNENSYLGYSLDDEASYFETKENGHYSALAINNDDYLVSGNFFAYKSGNTIYSANTLTGGYFPALGTGYIFKELPSGNLQFDVFNGELRPYEGNGVYYASFEYPVEYSKLENQAYFYVWNAYDVYMPENVDNIAEITYKELGGRTELMLKGGIQYKNQYGGVDINGNIVSGINISNISIEDFQKAINETSDVKNIIGMKPRVVKVNTKGEETITTANAINESKTYVDGVDVATNVTYNISEGYPCCNYEGYKNLIKHYNSTINYAGQFSKIAKYQFFKGRGIEVVVYDENNNMSYGTGKRCKDIADTDSKFIITPKNNDAYVYINTGTLKRPCYRILCEYTNDTGHTSPIGGLCFLTITYIDAQRYNITYEYKNKNGEVVTSKRMNSGSTIKYSISKILENEEEKITIVKPIANKRIRYNTEDLSWRQKIDEGALEYRKWEQRLRDNTESPISISSADTFYYVEEYNNNIYKIFPLLLPENKMNDGIDIENGFYISMPYSGGETVITVTYEIDKVNSGDTGLMQAVNGESAMSKLKYNYNSFDAECSGLTIDNNFFEMKYLSSSFESGVTNQVEAFKVKYKFNLNIKAAVGQEKNSYIKDSVYFYISNIENGVRLDIERIIENANTIVAYFNDTLTDSGNSFYDAFSTHDSGYEESFQINCDKNYIETLLASEGVAVDNIQVKCVDIEKLGFYYLNISTNQIDFSLDSLRLISYRNEFIALLNYDKSTTDIYDHLQTNVTYEVVPVRGFLDYVNNFTVDYFKIGDIVKGVVMYKAPESGNMSIMVYKNNELSFKNNRFIVLPSNTSGITIALNKVGYKGWALYSPDNLICRGTVESINEDNSSIYKSRIKIDEALEKNGKYELGLIDETSGEFFNVALPVIVAPYCTFRIFSKNIKYVIVDDKDNESKPKVFNGRISLNNYVNKLRLIELPKYKECYISDGKKDFILNKESGKTECIVYIEHNLNDIKLDKMHGVLDYCTINNLRSLNIKNNDDEFYTTLSAPNKHFVLNDRHIYIEATFVYTLDIPSFQIGKGEVSFKLSDNMLEATETSTSTQIFVALKTEEINGENYVFNVTWKNNYADLSKYNVYTKVYIPIEEYESSLMSDKIKLATSNNDTKGIEEVLNNVNYLIKRPTYQVNTITNFKEINTALHETKTSFEMDVFTPESGSNIFIKFINVLGLSRYKITIGEKTKEIYGNEISKLEATFEDLLNSNIIRIDK